MVQLSQLVPSNYLVEKEKFFHDHDYNPQFEYAQPIDSSFLVHYGTPEAVLLQKSRQLIESNIEYRKEQIARRSDAMQYSQAEVHRLTQNYLAKLGIAERYEIVWSKAAITRCTIAKNHITFRIGADFSPETLQGILDHELGTHALRRINDEKQPWHDHRKKFELSNHLITEEGLATVHKYLSKPRSLLYGAALKYVAVGIAQKHSFAQTWKQLQIFYESEEKLWNTVFRAKRGLSDASKPGGYTKDIVYFQGAYEVVGWLAQHDFDPTKLYVGRISVVDVERAWELRTADPQLPTLFLDNPAAYRDKIKSIIHENQFSW
jgi:hypothetical protein